jgi:hypothetical protein
MQLPPAGLSLASRCGRGVFTERGFWLGNGGCRRWIMSIPWYGPPRPFAKTQAEWQKCGMTRWQSWTALHTQGCTMAGPKSGPDNTCAKSRPGIAAAPTNWRFLNYTQPGDWRAPDGRWRLSTAYFLKDVSSTVLHSSTFACVLRDCRGLRGSRDCPAPSPWRQNSSCPERKS